jgi:hypothetical protein
LSSSQEPLGGSLRQDIFPVSDYIEVREERRNAYLNNFFWRDPSGDKAGREGRGGRRRGESLYAEKNWPVILEQMVDRVYLLRCQLLHGAATYGSRLNRMALRNCTTMADKLVPAVMQVWIDHGADEDWGLLCYPPIVQQPSRPNRPR